MVKAIKMKLGLPNGNPGIGFIYNYAISDGVTLDPNNITRGFINAFGSAFESFFNIVSKNRYSNDPNFTPPTEEQLTVEEEEAFVYALSGLMSLNISLDPEFQYAEDATTYLKAILSDAVEAVIREGGIPSDFSILVNTGKVIVEMTDNDIGPTFTEEDIDRNSEVVAGVRGGHLEVVQETSSEEESSDRKRSYEDLATDDDDDDDGAPDAKRQRND